MRSCVCAITALCLALATASPGLAQSERDFVFTDEFGHLVIRFAGTGATGLDASHAYEVLNAEFSSMVHDRLHADIQFAEEARDPAWAASTEPRIAAHIRQAGLGLTNVAVECKALSCRVLMEQQPPWTVPAHREALDAVQKSLDDFVEANTQDFEPVYMMTAYYQDGEDAPHIKAFLRRSDQGQPARTD